MGATALTPTPKAASGALSRKLNTATLRVSRGWQGTDVLRGVSVAW